MRHLLQTIPAVVCLLIVNHPLPAQGDTPWVSAVMNSASYAADGWNRADVAPGTLLVIFGQSLGPQQLQQAASFPLPFTLAGVSVKVTVGGTTWNAPMVYAWWRQVAAVLPSATPPGEGFLTLTYEGRTSSPASLRVVPSAFGTYTVSSNGRGSGVITTPDYQLPSYSSPAGPGDTLILWGTGLGAVEGVEEAGPLPGNRFPDTEVYVGNRRAAVSYAGRSGCCAGVDQITFAVPSGAQGCHVPVAVRRGGFTSNFAALPVAPRGQPCADPVGIPPDMLRAAAAGDTVGVGAIVLGPSPILEGAGSSMAGALASRLSARFGIRISERDLAPILRARGLERRRALGRAVERYRRLMKGRTISAREAARAISSLDEFGAVAAFAELRGLEAVAAQFAAILPPPGACTVVRDWSFHTRDWGTGGRGQDAGPELILTGPAGTHTLRQVRGGEYQGSLGSTVTNRRLPPGTYNVSAAGGRDVGAFTASVSTSGLEWTNRSAVPWVDRGQPLTVTWSGGRPNGYVLFGGASSVSNLRSAFVCIEEAGRGTLTVPEFVLGAMPKTVEDRGVLFMAPHPLENRFAAPGIDVGYFADLSSDSSEVEFR